MSSSTVVLYLYDYAHTWVIVLTLQLIRNCCGMWWIWDTTGVTTSCVARGWNNGKLRLECKEQRGQQVLVLGVTCNLIISWGGVSCFIWDVVVYTRYSHLSNDLRKITATENFIRYQLRNMFFEGKWLFISYVLYFVSNAKNIPYASASKAKYEKFYSL